MPRSRTTNQCLTSLADRATLYGVLFFVLQIRAVEHKEDDEQTLVGLGADKRVLLPQPLACFLERLMIETESAAELGTSTEAVGERERRQQVHGRLVIADGRQNARHHHFDRAFRRALALRRLLHTPFAPFRTSDSHPGIHARAFRLDERVHRVGIRSVVAAPRTIEQILRAQIIGRLPQLRDRRFSGRHGRAHFGRRAHRRVNRQNGGKNGQHHAGPEGRGPRREL